MQTRFGLVALLLLLSGALLAPAASGRGEPRRTRIALQSVYLTERVGNARRITFDGVLGGRGTLTLDPNTCTLNPFGDPSVCTEIAALPIDVEMRQAKLADPLGRDRRLYLLAGSVPKGMRFHLVVPRRWSEPHRLVVDLGGDRRRVLVMEPIFRPKPQPIAKDLCAHAVYEAERKGSTIVLRATGTHPAGGYTTFFERLPLRIFPPQFKLVCTPPKDAGPAMSTPIRAETSFDAGGTAVRAVIVHDARGAHEVPVP